MLESHLRLSKKLREWTRPESGKENLVQKKTFLTFPLLMLLTGGFFFLPLSQGPVH